MMLMFIIDILSISMPFRCI